MIRLLPGSADRHILRGLTGNAKAQAVLLGVRQMDATSSHAGQRKRHCRHHDRGGHRCPQQRANAHRPQARRPGIADLDNIPARLRCLPRWVLVVCQWREDPETGEFVERETHISFHTGRECGPDVDPRDWASFEAVRSWPDVFSGIAFALGWTSPPDAAPGGDAP